MNVVPTDPIALPPIELPPPSAASAVSFYQAVAERRTIRDIVPAPLPLSLLSTLLWAANGVNRETGPFGAAGRTAASASNSQEIDLYVLLESGAYLYEAPAHRLAPIALGDLRALAMNNRQGTGPLAPVQLVYVVDLHRLTHTVGLDEPGLHDPEIQKSYYFIDTGIIAGNVYLFAAAHGLASWFHNCKKQALAEGLLLRAEQKALFAHSIGWPARGDQTPGL
jgi:nitroreductase